MNLVIISTEYGNRNTDGKGSCVYRQFKFKEPLWQCSAVKKVTAGSNRDSDAMRAKKYVQSSGGKVWRKGPLGGLRIKMKNDYKTSYEYHKKID
jgi:hypothetical protein